MPATHRLSETLDETIARRAGFLTLYQNAAYAARYTSWVERIRAAEAAALPGNTALADAVARALFKLMAYKDEYEVARLYTDGDFLKRVAEQFEGDYKLKFHLAPPLFAERDPANGHLRKSEYGPWMLAAFRLLARLKFLRGTAFDIFGRSEERRAERQAIVDYEARLARDRRWPDRRQPRRRGRARRGAARHSRLRPRQGGELAARAGQGRGARRTVSGARERGGARR